MAQNFGSGASGGYNQPTQKYKDDPSVENYIKIRRQHPEAEIEVSSVGGFESMFFMRDEFARHGVDAELLGGILDADHDAISEVSLQLLEKIVEARAMAAAGQTHLIRRKMAIPEKLINWTICCALDSLSWNGDLTIPRDLIVLVREQLGGSSSHYEKEGELRQNKRRASFIAGQLLARGINPTFKIVGEFLEVAPSTVKRWFEPGEFERARDEYAKWYDSDGNFLPISKLRE